MGREVGRVAFTEQDHAQFRSRLTECLSLLGKAVTDPDFGAEPPTLGAELEFSLIELDGRPAPVNAAVREAAQDDLLTLEVARFNLEANLTPVPARGHPFTALAAQATRTLTGITTAAPRHRGVTAVPIGTLPTLTPADLTAQALTALPRYHALEQAWSHRRSVPFDLPVGERGLLRAESVAVQGAACSWQVHLTVAPYLFHRAFNAAQLATGPALAAAGNSPFPLGRPGWQEARIPMYEHGFGDRSSPGSGPRRPRVGFGPGWMQGGPLTAFEAAMRHYDVLLPDVSPANDHDATGHWPALEELRLHLSTVWWWNRPVYDPLGHLRIEFRALPSGPTPLDMAANAAFLVGLTLFLTADGRDVAQELPFTLAKTNFYRAARDGLHASLWWPSPGTAPREYRAGTLVEELLPRAREGLALLSVATDEADDLLDLLHHRVATGRTGAWWQQQTREVLRRRGTAEGKPAERMTGGTARPSPPNTPRSERERDSAELAELTVHYAQLAAGATPVHTWKPPTLPLRSHR
ncbi:MULTISPECIES: glutamate--cysteine ligase [unclassified Streptomyces]|uniref:glutamate--cysteine ligase n=1 Tax=unclassified Streptomyces TaxID=2593676 RepID=UPI00382E7A70